MCFIFHGGELVCMSLGDVSVYVLLTAALLKHTRLIWFRFSFSFCRFMADLYISFQVNMFFYFHFSFFFCLDIVGAQFKAVVFFC